MKKMVLFLFALSSYNMADITATTEFNKKVLLKDNGQWKYIEDEASENRHDVLYKDKNIEITLEEITILGAYAKIKERKEAEEKRALRKSQRQQHYPEAKTTVERTTLMLTRGPDKRVKKLPPLKFNKYYATKLVLNIKAINTKKIIEFSTHSSYSGDIASTTSSGVVKVDYYSHVLLNSLITLTDEYKNKIKINKLTPETTNSKLRPNQEKKITIVSDEYPIESSKYLNLSFPRNTFSNEKKVKIKIPI